MWIVRGRLLLGLVLVGEGVAVVARPSLAAGGLGPHRGPEQRGHGAGHGGGAVGGVHLPWHGGILGLYPDMGGHHLVAHGLGGPVAHEGLDAEVRAGRTLLHARRALVARHEAVTHPRHRAQPCHGGYSVTRDTWGHVW